jgi:branched-chain amino acid transport system ATP-binding protein
MTPALAIDTVEGGYEPGLPILRGASLAVAPGEIVALLGPERRGQVHPGEGGGGAGAGLVRPRAAGWARHHGDARAPDGA